MTTPCPNLHWTRTVPIPQQDPIKLQTMISKLWTMSSIYGQARCANKHHKKKVGGNKKKTPIDENTMEEQDEKEKNQTCQLNKSWQCLHGELKPGDKQCVNGIPARWKKEEVSRIREKKDNLTRRGVHASDYGWWAVIYTSLEWFGVVHECHPGMTDWQQSASLKDELTSMVNPWQCNIIKTTYLHDLCGPKK